jgi:hypothetical protein
MSDPTRPVRQTVERLIKKYPEATDAHLRILLERAARVDEELKDALDQWRSRVKKSS